MENMPAQRAERRAEPGSVSACVHANLVASPAVHIASQLTYTHINMLADADGHHVAS